MTTLMISIGIVVGIFAVLLLTTTIFRKKVNPPAPPIETVTLVYYDTIPVDHEGRPVTHTKYFVLT